MNAMLAPTTSILPGNTGAGCEAARYALHFLKFHAVNIRNKTMRRRTLGKFYLLTSIDVTGAI
jgi:hypothetical protein